MCKDLCRNQKLPKCLIIKRTQNNGRMMAMIEILYDLSDIVHAYQKIAHDVANDCIIKLLHIYYESYTPLEPSPKG